MDESAKPKECLNRVKPGHSKRDKYFSTVKKKQLAQLDKADRPEIGKTEFLGDRGQVC